MAVGLLLEGVCQTAQAQNRLDYLNVLKGTLDAVQQQQAEQQRLREQQEQEEAVRRQQQEAIQRAQDAQNRRAQEERRAAEMRESEQREVERLRAQLEEKKKELALAEQRKKEREALAAMPNPWSGLAAKPVVLRRPSRGGLECDCQRIKGSCTAKLSTATHKIIEVKGKSCATVSLQTEGRSFALIVAGGQSNLPRDVTGEKRIRIESCRVCQSVMRPVE